jgi:class 3 adenylate cyclase/tetratricopeptide (TPR) repeat protein
MNDTPAMKSDPTSPSGERRQVTVLFADMVGFTTISERLGEEGTYALIQPIYELMAGAVKEQGGSVKDFTGDGIMALFGVPEALEDAPLRACRAGLLIHERLAAAAPAIEAKLGVRPQMRIGVNSGLAVVTQIRGESAAMTALGDTVNLASRLQTLAEPGTVYLSEAMQRLVQGLVETTFAGVHPIKGKAEPQKVYRLDSVREGATRFEAAVGRGLTTYVGRDREMEILERGLAEARNELRVLDIVAEPGMGKSRLLYEFRERLDKTPAFILAGNCSPDGQQTPLLPFIEVVRGSFRVAAGEAEALVAHKLDDGLRFLGLASAQSLGLLLKLLGLRPPEGALDGLDGTLIGLRTRDLLYELLQARCRFSPTVMIFEDLHWIDTASAELLGRIVNSSSQLPLMILHTSRPEYRAPWGRQPNVRGLSLKPLTAEATSRIVEERLGAGRLPKALGRLLANRAEGNALFAEEIASFLVERAMVHTSPEGVELDPAAIAKAVPASVQSLLTARVDRLVVSDRALLQAASVIGRQFEAGLLASVAYANGDVEPRLAAMCALDLVHREDQSPDYVFKHALLRDVLYNSMLSAKRADLHGRIAEEIERRSGNRLIEVAEQLAHHYDLAARPDKAFTYLVLAADKSLDIYSLEQAEQYFLRALTVWEDHSSCSHRPAVAHAVVRLLETTLLKGDFVQVGRRYEQYRRLLSELGASRDFVLASYYQAQVLTQRLELRTADVLMSETLAVADAIVDGRSRAYARGGLLYVRTIRGADSPEVAEEMKATLLDDSRRYGDSYIRNWSFWLVAWDYMYRGLMKEARDTAMQLIETGKQLNDPRAFGLANWLLAWISILADRYEDGASYSEESIRFAITPLDIMNGKATKAVTDVFQGRAAEGLAQLEVLAADMERIGHRYNGTAVAIGGALALTGRLAEGFRCLKRAIALFDDVEDRTNAAWARIVLAEIYLQILSGDEKPSMAFLMKNIVPIASTIAFGAGRVKVLLEKAAAHSQLSESGMIRARINMNLGLLHKHKKQPALARRYLEKARAPAEVQGATVMVGKIDAALAELA